MPTITPRNRRAYREVGTGRRWKADALARELGLDDATRTRLKIKTIGAVDCGKSKRMNRRRRKRIAADRARRAKAGARPHAQSAAATQPWLDEGISRRTWYRRRANGTVGTDSRPIDRRSSIDKNQCYEASDGTADPGREHGDETNTFIAKPLSLPSSRVRQSCDQGQVVQATGLDDATFRAVHFEHFQLLTVIQRSPEQKVRLTELNEIIEAERERRALRRSLITASGAEMSNFDPAWKEISVQTQHHLKKYQMRGGKRPGAGRKKMSRIVRARTMLPVLAGKKIN